MFNKEDLDQIQSRGSELSKIKNQIKDFINGFPFIKLTAPTAIDHGIKILNENEIQRWSEYWDKNSPNCDVVKFVPASGAATRMFKTLFDFSGKAKYDKNYINEILKDENNEVTIFLKRLNEFAFYNDLNEAVVANDDRLNDLIDNEDYIKLIEYLLYDPGLNYANLPKGLLQFHKYNNGSRTPVEEHLVEGAHYCKNDQAKVFLHFTVSPEHIEKFKKKISAVQIDLEKEYEVQYNITFSVQKPSTDTIAVDLNNKPFRESDDKLFFRPGGHGALIENLNDLNGEIIFIKNIDNVVPDHLKDETYKYKKALGGYLIYLQDKIFGILRQLRDEMISESEIKKILPFLKKVLELEIDEDILDKNRNEIKVYLEQLLDRPLRICGMVKNVGEPGGGPFWVKNIKGEISLQIVESSQIDLDDPNQKQLFEESTHFNPVDLVCGVRDCDGNQYDLSKFIDPSTGFISKKSKDGKDLKAQELPGLWNGAMADWITLFVEVPIITFNPVKTVNDLLRKEHQ